MWPYPLILASDEETDTSVVTLVLKSDETVVEKDPLFEILDLQSYILIPVNKLPSRLEIQLHFQREQNQLILTAKNNRQVIIDFNKRTYRVDDTLKWPDQVPMVFKSDFFVSPLVIEYLANVKTDWNFKYQELTIQGNWKIAESSNSPVDVAGEPVFTENVVYQEGASCSLGTVRYELSWEYQKDDLGLMSSEGKLKLRGDGRAGKWAISLGGEVEYDETDEQTAELSLIRAKYNDNNKLVIFGDSGINLENTLRQQDIRGILIMSPTNAFTRFLIPYTTVSGKAEPGDRVILYVNGKPLDELIVSNGKADYRFNDVPLAIKRLNIIKVVIEKPSGARTVTEKRVASNIRILDQTTNEWMVAGGYYRQNENEEWEKKFSGFKIRKALTENFFIDSEAVITQTPESNLSPDKPEKILYGADTGIAFRLGQNIICAMDWLVGGEADDPADGWKTSLLYCLEKGFIEGIVFYIDPAITRTGRVQQDPGQGFKLLGELDITDKTSYQVKAEITEPLNNIGEFIAQNFELRRNHKYGPDFENLFTIGLKNERTENIPYYEHTDGEKDLSRIFADQSVYAKNTNFRNYLAVDHIQTQDEKTTTYNVIHYEADYIKMINELFMFNLSAQAKHKYGEEASDQLNFESNLKWLARDRAIGIYAKTKFYGDSYWNGNSVYYEKPFEMDTGTLGAWGKYYFTTERSLYASLDWNVMEHKAFYTYGLINFTHTTNNGNGKYYAEYSYASPFKYSSDSRIDEDQRYNRKAQHAYRLGIQHTTKKGLEIKLEMERLYENLTTDNAQRIYRITCGQAIGFSGKYRRTLANDDENLSFVGGIVYLDENGNSQYDKNEKTLPEIKMSLNGRRITTNDKGEYLFKHVEPDAYRLYFDLRSLPADYTPVTNQKLFKLKENENMFFDFGVTLNGSVSGRVFLDQNGNRIYDEGDKPLDWVAIILDNGKKKVFTGHDGVFYFENIPLGEHTIEVMSDSLPKDMVVNGRKSFDFPIKEKALDVRDIYIPVVYRFKE